MTANICDTRFPAVGINRIQLDIHERLRDRWLWPHIVSVINYLSVTSPCSSKTPRRLHKVFESSKENKKNNNTWKSQHSTTGTSRVAKTRLKSKTTTINKNIHNLVSTVQIYHTSHTALRRHYKDRPGISRGWWLFSWRHAGINYSLSHQSSDNGHSQ